MDNRSYNGFNSYAVYKNYWRRQQVHGEGGNREIGSIPKDNFEREKKWRKVVVSITLVLVVITLVLTIYIFTSLFTDNYCAKKTIIAAPSQKTTSPSQTTTSPSQKTTAPSQATTSPSQTTTSPSQTTTTREHATTSSLPEITFKPDSERVAFAPFLPFRPENGDTAEEFSADVTFTVNVARKIFGTTHTDSFSIIVAGSLGHLMVADKSYVKLAASEYDKCLDGSKCLFHRQVQSDEDKAALSCLLNGTTILDAFVSTWVNISDYKKDIATFQCILVYAEDLNVFVIRVYNENVANLASAVFGFSFPQDQKYNQDTASEVANKRIINNISEKPEGNRFEDLIGNPKCGW